MRSRHSKLFGIFWSIFVLVVLGFLFSAAYYLVHYVQSKLGWQLPGAMVQVICSFLGLFLAGVTLSSFSRFFIKQQENVFTPIIQALERIARGDFSIQLGEEYDNGRWNELAISVNKMARQLGQMENMRQEFVSNVSHEIQSPLTSIRGFAQVLQDENLTIQERKHYLEIIETESMRLSRIADDLLKLTSLDSDEVKLKSKNYRLDKQIRSLILTCEPQWSAKNIEMGISLEELSITADEDMLSQVWLNLLHNSIKFTPEEGTIKIDLYRRGDWAQFEISDTGLGISPEDQMHIFERFYKADKSRTQKKEGSGLGLAIVKKIVELHKGKIDVHSELGNGSTFIVSLPFE
jgi:two-component system, OmpR family, phosphate regulon sensor histidine kinase PhoR